MKTIRLTRAVLALSTLYLALAPASCTPAVPQKTRMISNPNAMLPDIIAEAKIRAARPLVKRVFRADDLAPEYLDTRVAALSRDSNRREFFALAMSDTFMAWDVAETLPLLAVASRECPDAKTKAQLRARLLAQLEEVATWHPLNRPGWTLYENGPSVGENFNDGSWLGTGSGIRAITSTLRLIGDDVPPDLKTKLHALLAQEILAVRDDFTSHRPWYWNTPVSNQFVLPNVGVLLACLELGKGKGDADYEFAVANLLRSMDAQGKDGAHHEGTRYGSFTTREILEAAFASQRAGDDRLITHRYLQNFGNWLLHLLQPGGADVNFFDGSDSTITLQHASNEPPLSSRSATNGQTFLDCLMLCALAGQDGPRAILAHNFPHLYPSALSWEYSRAASKSSAPLPATFASFSSSSLVTWRSSWDDKADGVWVRGGSTLDSHDHRDRGHVNYIVNGRGVLIECGSGDYGDPNYEAHYEVGAAHNVLQVGENGIQRPGSANIEVQKLDASGGDVVVDASGTYDPHLLKSWTRRAVWNAQCLTLDDRGLLAPDETDTILFRFHLAGKVIVNLQPQDDGKTWRASWPGGAISFAADAPISIETATAIHGITFTQSGEHTVLVVRSRDKKQKLQLTTTLQKSDFKETH